MPMIRKRSIEMTRVFNATRGRVAIAQRDANSPPISSSSRPTLVPPPRDRPRGSSESWNFVLGIGTFFGVGEEYLALKGSEAVTRCRDKLVVSTRRGLFDNCGKIF